MKSTLKFEGIDFELANLNAQIEEKKRLFISEASSVIKAAKEKDKKAICNHLYWYYPHLVGINLIASMLEVPLKKARSYISPIQYENRCRDCGEMIVVDISSQNQLKNLVLAYRYDRQLNQLQCEACKQKQKRRSVAQQEEWLREHESRKARIVELRTMQYKEYLQTEEWQETRRQALKRADFKCQLCNGRGLLDVHHRTYERRGYENAKDLIVLCRDCHSKFHDKTTEN